MMRPNTLCSQEFFSLVSDPKVVDQLFASEGASAPLRVDLAADDPEVLNMAYHERAGTLRSPEMLRTGAMMREELKLKYDLSHAELNRALSESYNRAQDKRGTHVQA